MIPFAEHSGNDGVLEMEKNLMAARGNRLGWSEESGRKVNMVVTG